MEVLGENSGNLQAYKTMAHKLQRPFDEIDSEHKFMKYMTEAQCYILPEDMFIHSKPKENVQRQATVAQNESVII